MYREVCAKNYTTECLDAPACNKGDTKLSAETCDAVKVISPNGGETFTQGTQNAITLTGGDENGIRIGLVKSDYEPKDGLVYGWISLDGLPNSQITWDGKYVTDLAKSIQWDVVPGSYKIIGISKNPSTGCTWSTEGVCNFDISDAPFSIVATPTTAPTTNATTCTDSDGGINYEVKGLVNGIWSDGDTASNQPDVCGGYILNEYYCNVTASPYILMKAYNCPYGCSDGACLAAPAKSKLQCKNTYSKTYHSGGCDAKSACSPDQYASCQTQKSGFFGAVISYSESCTRIYTTACLDAPACNKGDVQLSKAAC
jgi:hypothetical protein